MDGTSFMQVDMPNQTKVPADGAQLVQHLQDVRGEMVALFRVAMDANNKRHLDRVHTTMDMIQRSVETGSHALAVVGLAGLINAQEEMRSDWNTQNMRAYHMLETLVDSVSVCMHTICKSIGIPPPKMEPLTLQSATEPALSPLRKRQRIANPAGGLVQSSPQGCETTPLPFPNVIDMLRDRSNAFEQFAMPKLSAAECVLLDTVVVESALCPDISALRDVYHPRTCLYATEDDQCWCLPTNDKDTVIPDVHLGFHAATVLVEFCCHRELIRRFTMAHLLSRMGFGTSSGRFEKCPLL
jgi:hypothetical protein